MFPTYPSSLSRQQKSDPAKRLAESQRAGTPQAPNGPKYKPLNMLKPPETPKIGGAKVDFMTSDFAGGQLYPGPTRMRLPISGEMPASAVAQDPQLKYSGPPGDKPTKKKIANVISPALQLSSSQSAGDRHLTRPGPAVGNDAKPVGYGKPLSAKSWANRTFVA